MKAYTVAILSVIVSSCASMRPVDVSRPSEISVNAALADIASGLIEFRRLGQASNNNFGLLVDEVQITLKVTASATDSSKLVVDVSNVKPSLLSGGTAGVNLTQEAGSEGNRDNTVVVKLKNVYTAQLNAQGMKQSVRVDRQGGLSIGDVRLLSKGAQIDCEKPGGDLEKFICEEIKKK